VNAPAVRFVPRTADVVPVWWTWVLGGLAAWLVVGLSLAFVVGRGIRMADEWSPGSHASAPLTTEDLAGPRRRPVAVARRRRAVPLPPMGIALAASVVALETTGFVLRLTGATGPLAQLLSMDAPFSLPRMFVAALFATAAFAAVAGAAAQPGRRAWWTAVALVAAAIAAIKVGSNVHARGMDALTDLAGRAGAVLISALAASAVVGALWFVSRNERRDRRRMLSVLSLYGVAAVGLSAVTSVVADAYGRASTWTASAAFLEESGEALAGVTYLLAVLVGVAPRLVLPASWVLRRKADALGLEGLGSRSADHGRDAVGP
jgi:hypothetical protein